MPNLLEVSGHTAYPAALDTINTFLPMTGSPLAVSQLTAGIDGVTQTIPVQDCGVFEAGPSVVTIQGTQEIIYYQSKSAESGAGSLQNCIRNWGNNVRRYAITVADATSDYFEIDGDHLTEFPAGFVFTVYGSTGNDQEYTVSAGGPSLVSGDTRIPVDENVTSNTGDGLIYVGSAGVGQSAAIDTLVYHLLGEEQLRIMSEALVAIQTRMGKTLSTDPVSHEYRINQLEGVAAGTVFSFGLLGVAVEGTVVDGDVVTWDGGSSYFRKSNIGTGDIPHGTVREVTNVYPITASDGVAETFTIAGEHTAEFPPGASFTVSGSSGGSDDGAYTVVSSTVVGSDTVITVADVPTGTNDGNITVSAWKVTLGGRDSGHTSLTPGSNYYASAGTPGAISTTQSEWFVGTAYTTTDLLVSIHRDEPWPRLLRGVSFSGSVSNNDVVGWDGSAGQYERADADLSHGVVPPIGVAINVSGAVGDIVLEGPVSGFTGLTAGNIYWLAPVAGTLSSAQPYESTDQGWIIGQAISTTELRVQICKHANAKEVACMNRVGNQSTVQDELNNYLYALTNAQVSVTDGSTDVTGAELERLTDNSDVSSSPQLHHHDSIYSMRYMSFSTQGRAIGTEHKSVGHIWVPTGKTAKVLALGGLYLRQHAGTVSWSSGDPTLVTISGSTTADMTVGDAVIIDNNSTAPYAEEITALVTSIVDSTSFRISVALGGSQSGYYLWTAERMAATYNGLWWEVVATTSGGRTVHQSGQLPNYSDVSGSGWICPAGGILSIGVHATISASTDFWYAWARLELY